MRPVHRPVGRACLPARLSTRRPETGRYARRAGAGPVAQPMKFFAYRLRRNLGLLVVLHAGVGLPQGLLGWILDVLFIGVAGSGLVGLAMSRSFPAQLRARGDEVIFERIPAHRRHLQKKVEHLVLHVAAEAHSTL